jgi:hypothetical protein
MFIQMFTSGRVGWNVQPSTHGSTYAAYLSELAGSNAPAFLSHYYNIYSSHTTGGLAIGKKVNIINSSITKPLD